MILNVILGKNIDTDMWIENLKRVKDSKILVIDYDFNKESEIINNILYMSPEFARGYLKSFDSVQFYKSLYAFPGMHTQMSSLFEKNDEL